MCIYIYMHMCRSEVRFLPLTELGYATWNRPPYCYYPLPVNPLDANSTIRTISVYITQRPSEGNNAASYNPNSDPNLLGPPAVFGPNNPNNDVTCNSNYRVNCTTYLGSPISSEEKCRQANCWWEPSLANSTRGT